MLETSVLFMFSFFLIVNGYFFVTTRGTQIVHSLFPNSRKDSHIYWIYTKMWLIKLTDQKRIIAAILLFQYDRLVDQIVEAIGRSLRHDGRLLITSCAFGDVIPRIVRAALEQSASRVVITDLIKNELIHVRGKIRHSIDHCDLLLDNATESLIPDRSVSMNVLFFLLHELPNGDKVSALREAMRVLEPGGTLVIADFHKPSAWVLRVLGWMYFTVYEQYGRALWGTEYDPIALIEREHRCSWTKETFFFGNFQFITVRKN